MNVLDAGIHGPHQARVADAQYRGVVANPELDPTMLGSELAQ
jgi:hypothetical protein